MRGMRRLPLVVITILLFCAAAVAQQVSLNPAGGREFTIAVVRDGPLPDDRVLRMVREELVQLAGPTTKVTFSTTNCWASSSRLLSSLATCHLFSLSWMATSHSSLLTSMPT